jgi:hypothetical protein
MDKIIEKVKKDLGDWGFNNQDYIISLQGPTLFFTKQGKEKLESKPEIVNKIPLILKGFKIIL